MMSYRVVVEASMGEAHTACGKKKGFSILVMQNYAKNESIAAAAAILLQNSEDDFPTQE